MIITLEGEEKTEIKIETKELIRLIGVFKQQSLKQSVGQVCTGSVSLFHQEKKIAGYLHLRKRQVWISSPLGKSQPTSLEQFEKNCKN